MIKLFNTIVFSSMVFPLFLICSRLIGSRIICFITTFSITLFPWKVVTNLIVAEPLYFTLLIWSIFLYMYYLEYKTTKRAIFYGLSLGLLFLCKQVGIVLLIATFFALAYEFYFIENKDITYLKKHFIIFIAAFLIIFPWLIRNYLNTSDGGLGYASEFENVRENINIWNVFRAGISQISYLSLGCYTFFFSIFINTLIKFKKQPSRNQSFIVLIAFFTLGIIGISALHHLQVPTYPYGRYVTTAIPFIIIVAISNMGRDKQVNLNKLHLIVISICSLGINIYSNVIPLTLHVKGYFNAFDTAIWSKFFLGDNNLYSVDAVYSALQNSTITIPIVIFVLTVITVLLIKTKCKYICLPLFFFIAILGSINNNAKEVSAMKANGNTTNELYRHMIQHNIPPQKVYKLSENLGNIDYERTWFNTFYSDTNNLIKVLPLDRLLTSVDYFFDFGGPDTPIVNTSLAIQAPWIAESFFDQTNIYGFDISSTYINGDSTIGSVFFENTASPSGLEDVIYGVTENYFYIDVSPGEYNLTINTNNSPLPFTPQLNCSIYLNDTYLGRLDSNTSFIKINDFKNTGDLLKIKLVPDEGSVWSVGTLELQSTTPLDLSGKYILTDSTTDFSLTSKLLPLELIFSNSHYKLYYLN